MSDSSGSAIVSLLNETRAKWNETLTKIIQGKGSVKSSSDSPSSLSSLLLFDLISILWTRHSEIYGSLLVTLHDSIFSVYVDADVRECNRRLLELRQWIDNVHAVRGGAPKMCVYQLFPEEKTELDKLLRGLRMEYLSSLPPLPSHSVPSLRSDLSVAQQKWHGFVQSWWSKSQWTRDHLKEVVQDFRQHHQQIFGDLFSRVSSTPLADPTHHLADLDTIVSELDQQKRDFEVQLGHLEQWVSLSNDVPDHHLFCLVRQIELRKLLSAFHLNHDDDLSACYEDYSLPDHTSPPEKIFHFSPGWTPPPREEVSAFHDEPSDIFSSTPLGLPFDDLLLTLLRELLIVQAAHLSDGHSQSNNLVLDYLNLAQQIMKNDQEEQPNSPSTKSHVILHQNVIEVLHQHHWADATEASDTTEESQGGFQCSPSLSSLSSSLTARLSQLSRL